MKQHEQELINRFVGQIKACSEDKYALNSERKNNTLRASCKAKLYADIEYISMSKIHWLIEAKSGDSPDRHNSIHKIFGELLKQARFAEERTGKVKVGLLIPENSLQFYGSAFAQIPKDKFTQFGKIIPRFSRQLTSSHSI